MLCFCICLHLLSVFVNAHKNVPMDEPTAIKHFVQLINSQCKQIPMDKKSINQLLNYCNIKENLENETFCDLACEAYGFNTTLIGKIMLNCDGDMEYLLRRINNLFQTELFNLQNDFIGVNIYSYNNVTLKTNQYMVEHYGHNKTIAQYMLKNLLDVQNRTKYPVKRERILETQIPAEELSLAMLPILDGHHKYLRSNEAKDMIDYEDETYDFDDDFVKFEKKQEELEREKQEREKNQTIPPQEFKISEFVEKRRETLPTTTMKTTTILEATTNTDKKLPDQFGLVTLPQTQPPPQPRLIEQFIDSDQPIIKLKEELEESKNKEFEKSKQQELAEIKKEEEEEYGIRGRELLTHNLPKGLYDLEELDYTGINNVAKAKLEEEESVARKLNYKDDYDDQINSRNMGEDYSDEEPDEIDRSGSYKTNDNEYKNKTQSNNNKETESDRKTKDKIEDDDDSEEVQSRDFTPAYSTDEEEEENYRNQKNKPRGSGLLNFFLSPFKTGFNGILRFARSAIIRVLDGAHSMAVSAITKPENWLDRLLNYPKNFAILRFIDNINKAKRWVNTAFDPFVESVSGKNHNSRNNPMNFISNPIRKSALSFVQTMGNNVRSFVYQFPLVGPFCTPFIDPAVEFCEGFINRMFPH